MEDFTKHCQDFRPNITYLAIGSAFSEPGAMQQCPPFLSALITAHPEFTFQIILLDPNMENPPKITENIRLTKYDADWYGNTNINIQVIRQYFSYASMLPSHKHDLLAMKQDNFENNSTVSKNFLFSLIDRIINSKNDTPANTYLLFVHDFSGNYIDKLSDFIWSYYQKQDTTTMHIYQKNVLIDLNSKIDSSCYPDINSIYFHPQLVLNANKAYEIFNPFVLDDFDIYTVIMQKYKNTNIKLLLMHAIMHRLNNVAQNIIQPYRQIRIALEGSKPYFPDLIINENVNLLIQDLDINNLQTRLELNNNIQLAHFIINKITNNLMSHLKSITGYLDMFKENNLRYFFGPFEDFCATIPLTDYYEPLKIFRECQKKLEIFFVEIDPTKYFTELSHHTIQFVIKNGKLPLYLELSLQDKVITNNNQNINDNCVNDRFVIMEF